MYYLDKSNPDLNTMKIGFLTIPKMLMTSFANAYELMYAAKAKAISEKQANAKDIDLVVIRGQKTDQPLHSAIEPKSDYSITDERALSRFDMVFVPTMWRNPAHAVKQNPQISEWLKMQWELGSIINTTGTGACFAAEAGLLDQQAATTHWYHFEEFEQRYPLVKLKKHHFIASAGKVFCAASINAQTDLVLHQVRRFMGVSVSEHLSRHFSHEVRQPYDRLSFDQEKDNAHPDEHILQAQLWLQNNLSQPDIKLKDLARDLGMSLRNFDRRFKQATETSPAKYLQHLRVKEAKDLLKQSDLNVGDIAFRVGYQDVSYFSKLFKKQSGISPSKWRTSIRNKLFIE